MVNIQSLHRMNITVGRTMLDDSSSMCMCIRWFDSLTVCMPCPPVATLYDAWCQWQSVTVISVSSVTHTQSFIHLSLYQPHQHLQIEMYTDRHTEKYIHIKPMSGYQMEYKCTQTVHRQMYTDRHTDRQTDTY